MGFSNGNLTSKAVKVEKGDRGEGFSLTVDSHFNIKNKRLTNVSPSVDDHDVTTKTFVADLLKTKAGTTYVNNELAKKPNKKYVNSVVSSSLQDYYTKAEIDDLLKQKTVRASQH